MRLPKAKTENIVVQDLGKELLVYDLTTHKAYTLNETSKIIFESCDGATAFDELKRKYQFTDDLIYLALDELKTNDLLEGYESNHFAGLSRREAFKKVGLASMVMLPLVAGIVAPQAANAASGRGTQANNTRCITFAPTGNSNECQSGYCVISTNADRFNLAVRCCARNGAVNGTTGYTFSGTSQDDCTSNAQSFCCSGAATYSGGCTCL